MSERLENYQAARAMKRISLRDLMAVRMNAGQSFTGAVGSSIKDKFKSATLGTMTLLGEKFDPLNVASAMMGRSRLGTAVAAKVLGRSGDEARYFSQGGRIATRRYSPLYTKVNPNSIQPPKREETVSDAFTKLYSLIKHQSDEKKKQEELDKNFRKIKDENEKRRHSDMLKAIKKMGGGTVTKVVKSDSGGGILGMLKEMISGLWDKIYNTFSEALDIAKAIKAAFGGINWLSLLTRFAGFLTTPLGVALLGGAFIWYLRNELVNLASKMIDHSKITPADAKYILENGTQNDIDKFQNRDGSLKGRKYLESIISGSTPETAKAILERNDEKEIANAGGRELLQRTISEGKVEKVQSEDKIKYVQLRPPGNNGLAQQNWDKHWAGKLDPKTGWELWPGSSRGVPKPASAITSNDMSEGAALSARANFAANDPRLVNSTEPATASVTPVATTPVVPPVMEASKTTADLNLATETGGSQGAPVNVNNVNNVNAANIPKDNGAATGDAPVRDLELSKSIRDNMRRSERM